MSTKEFLVDFAMGGVAAAISKTIIAPIERVKLLLQTQHVNPALIAKGGYSGIGDCFSKCIKEEGVFSLWRGNLANVIRYFPTQAFNFAFKDKLKGYFKKGVDKKTMKVKYAIASILAGAIGSSMSLTIVYPLDYSRTRLSTDVGKGAKDRKFNGLLDVMVKSVKADGPLALYRGYAISIAGIFVYRGCYFGFYDIANMLITDNLKVTGFTLRIVKFIIANCVTTTSGIASYPIDTVRRRMQMDVGKKVRTYKGSMHCFTTILKEEGPNGFFKGCLSNVFRGIGASLVLVMYDDFKALGKKYLIGNKH